MCRKLYDKLYEITGAKLDFNDKIKPLYCSKNKYLFV